MSVYTKGNIKNHNEILRLLFHKSLAIEILSHL